MSTPRHRQGAGDDPPRALSGTPIFDQLLREAQVRGELPEGVPPSLPADLRELTAGTGRLSGELGDRSARPSWSVTYRRWRQAIAKVANPTEVIAAPLVPVDVPGPEVSDGPEPEPGGGRPEGNVQPKPLPRRVPGAYLYPEPRHARSGAKPFAWWPDPEPEPCGVGTDG